MAVAGFNANGIVALPDGTVGDRVYVVNARFGIDNPGKADYQIVGTPLRGSASK